jgi:molybdenum cofactor synthesis domain-containing protein
VGTAAAIIIGDEILSGKVRDTNTPLLIDLLRGLGVPLARISFIGDTVEEIADEVRRCSERFETVITSGGVGPTHDDRTVEGVALAFGVPVVRSPEIADMIRAYWADRLTDSALAMADIPAGSRLVYGSDGLLPLVAIRNVFMLPGIPRLFAAKIKTVAELLHGRRPIQHDIYLSSDESRIAPILSQVDQELPEIKIGSYPKIGEPDHRVWITIEGSRSDLVEQATSRLIELLPPTEVVRVDRHGPPR